MQALPAPAGFPRHHSGAYVTPPTGVVATRTLYVPADAARNGATQGVSHRLTPLARATSGMRSSDWSCPGRRRSRFTPIPLLTMALCRFQAVPQQQSQEWF